MDTIVKNSELTFDLICAIQKAYQMLRTHCANGIPPYRKIQAIVDATNDFTPSIDNIDYAISLIGKKFY